MEHEEILNNIYRSRWSCKDYRETTELVEFWEPDYLEVLESLPDPDRDKIEKYLEVCGQQSDSLLLHAFRLGYEKGKSATIL